MGTPQTTHTTNSTNYKAMSLTEVVGIAANVFGVESPVKPGESDTRFLTRVNYRGYFRDNGISSDTVKGFILALRGERLPEPPKRGWFRRVPHEEQERAENLRVGYDKGLEYIADH